VREVGLDREMPCCSMWLSRRRTVPGAQVGRSLGGRLISEILQQREREIFGVAFGGLVPIENEGND
jgi:hypothetical protein